jgi:hypothetical protein
MIKAQDVTAIVANALRRGVVSVPPGAGTLVHPVRAVRNRAALHFVPNNFALTEAIAINNYVPLRTRDPSSRTQRY